MQRYLDTAAEKLSSSVVGHLRWHLNAIFRMAKSDGAVDFNPAEALYCPAGKPSGGKKVMTRSEVRQALEKLDLRHRLIFRMAVFDGMRPGEIFAIRLGKIGTNYVRVDQRVYGGRLDTPKGRKGKNTARVVALSPGTMTDIQEWTSLLLNRGEDSFLFPSENGRTPLRPNNCWKRWIRPQLETIGLEWVNFQVLRRTNASLARRARIDDKVAADQRGHGLGVSLEVYAVSDLEQKVDAVTRLETDIIGQTVIQTTEKTLVNEHKQGLE
jgi:integrase